MPEPESIYRTCVYCDSQFDAVGGDRTCRDCRRKSEGRDLDEIADEYDNAWKLGRVFDWRMLEDIAELLHSGERKDVAQLLGVPPNGKILRDLVRHAEDAMGVGWVLLSYHMNAPQSYQFSIDGLATLRRAWDAVEAETRRVFLESLQTDCVPSGGKPTGDATLFARVDKGPIFVGLTDEPKAELRRLNREWRPMEVEFIGLLPGTAEIFEIVQGALRRHRLEGGWYGEKAADLVRDILEESPGAIFVGLKDGPGGSL